VPAAVILIAVGAIPVDTALTAVTTAALSLDATVVLLTPVVFATAARLDMRARPYVYACTHLANSASLLLPVSNLTNLLAFAAGARCRGAGPVGRATGHWRLTSSEHW
jgi:di/tricarboxylate transporter